MAGKSSATRPRFISREEWYRNCEAAGIMGKYGIKTCGADVDPELVYQASKGGVFMGCGKKKGKGGKRY